MKRIITLALLIVSAAMLVGSSASAFSFDDIQLWAGSGSNKAALVIDWSDGIQPQSIAWGYMWDGTATGRDMLNAIKAADSRLFEPPDAYGGGTVYGLGFDVNGDGFTYVSGVGEDGHAADPGDHYKEGWYDGFWSYWTGETTDGAMPTCYHFTMDGSHPVGSFGFSQWGIANRTLTNGSWDGWTWIGTMSYDPSEWEQIEWSPSDPVAAAPVPEPGSLIAVLSGFVGLGGLVLRRRVS